ncbi:MAG: hypothetical protein IKN26_03320 [Eubacterium sp.]|nr:hypothetical protein [Eubacterium sp.]
MKYAGEMILIISTTGLGIYLSGKSKQKIIICRDLISLCDGLLLDLNYKITPAGELIESIVESRKLESLKFIGKNCLIRQKKIDSPLSDSDNKEVSSFLFMFGKSDVETQKKLVSNFRENINLSLKKYTDKHSKDSKLYITFGLFSGLIVSIIWS